MKKEESILDKLGLLTKEIHEAENFVKKLISERIQWAKENRSEFKKLYPKKGKIYEITDFKNAFKYCGYYHEELNDEVYFFKVEDARFVPHRDFANSYSDEKPTVGGRILDCNLNELGYSTERIFVNNLKNIKRKPSQLQSEFTKVYVMIDKNTGFYKIGRSKNPERRERTLQSEKPTIELMFTHDARIKDEKSLHNIFEHKRIRGEWFDLNGSDLVKIKEYFLTITQ